MSDNTTPLKRCKTCGRDLPLSEFHKISLNWSIECNSCSHFTPKRYSICQSMEASNSGPILKRCKDCQRDLPYTEFGKDGDYLHARCKICHGSYLGRTPRKKFDLPNGMRLCSKCGGEFPATLEWFYSVQGGKKLSTRCNKCAREINKIWRKENPDKARANQRKYRETHPDKFAESQDKYNETHREEVRTRSRNWQRENVHSARSQRQRQLWRAGNKEALIAASHRRRARERNLPSAFTTQEWKACLAYWQYCCAYCGKELDSQHRKKRTADHYIALSNASCPGTVKENIIPACLSCNSSKHTRDVAKWLIEKFGETEAEQKLVKIAEYFKSLVIDEIECE